MYEYVNQTPSSAPNNQRISNKNSTPIIDFILGVSPKKIRKGTFRLNFEIEFFKAGGTPIAVGDGVGIDNSLGIYGIFDQIVIANDNDVPIEKIERYNRFLATYNKMKMNNIDFCTNQSIMACTNSNYFSAMDILSKKHYISMPLYSGLLTGNDYKLDASKLNGCNLHLTLTPSSNFFFDLTGDGNAEGCYFDLSNVSVSYEAVPLSQEEMGEKAMTFTTINFSGDNVNNNYNTINKSIGEPYLLSFFINFLETNHAQNYDYNSLATPKFTDTNYYDPVKRIRILKDGVLNPIKYNLDNENGDIGANMLSGEIYRNAMDAFQPFMNAGNNYRNAVNTTTHTSPEIIDNGESWIIGCAYNPITKMGENFQTANLGIVIDKASTAPIDHKAYLFFKVRKIINFN